MGNDGSIHEVEIMGHKKIITKNNITKLENDNILLTTGEYKFEIGKYKNSFDFVYFHNDEKILVCQISKDNFSITFQNGINLWFDAKEQLIFIKNVNIKYIVEQYTKINGNIFTFFDNNLFKITECSNNEVMHVYILNRIECYQFIEKIVIDLNLLLKTIISIQNKIINLR